MKKSRRQFLKSITTAGVAAAAAAAVSQAVGQKGVIFDGNQLPSTKEKKSKSFKPVQGSGIMLDPETKKDLDVSGAKGPTGRSDLRVNNVPRSQLTSRQLQRERRAKGAVQTLKSLGQEVEIQWVKGTGKPQRRIVQLYG